MHGLSLEVKYFLRVCRVAGIDVTGLTFKPTMEAINRKYKYIDWRMNIFCFVFEQINIYKQSYDPCTMDKLIKTLALTLYHAVVECRVEDALIQERIAKNYRFLYNAEFRHTYGGINRYYANWIIAFKDNFLVEAA